MRESEVTDTISRSVRRTSPPDERPSDSGLRNILLIEDDEGVSRTFQRALTRDGFVVSMAADGVEGVRLAVWGFPDVIVLDLGLPLLDGKTLLYVLQAIPNAEDIPVVVITGHDIIQASVDLAQFGCVKRILAKPLTGSDLAHAVRETLKHAS